MAATETTTGTPGTAAGARPVGVVGADSRASLTAVGAAAAPAPAFTARLGPGAVAARLWIPDMMDRAPARATGAPGPGMVRGRAASAATAAPVAAPAGAA